jgi:hypothetical protein
MIIVWESDDPTKLGDRRYWIDGQEAERVHRLAPGLAGLAGTPRGLRLASVLPAAGADVEIGVPGPGGSVRLPLSLFAGTDPERTFLIVTHRRAPTEAERAVVRKRPPPWPPEVEELRQAWLRADAAGDSARATELRAELDGALEAAGFRTSRDALPWDPGRAVELQPGVFFQDERRDVAR